MRRRREKTGHFSGVTVQPMVSFKDGYELIIGSSVDPQFGPTLLFLARAANWSKCLKTARSASAAKHDARASHDGTDPHLSSAQRRSRPQSGGPQSPRTAPGAVRASRGRQSAHSEIDINPLLASPEGLVALDARVVLHDAGIAESALPRPAIRPYPAQYVLDFTLKMASR